MNLWQPPKWYRDLMFWLSAGLVPVNLFLFAVVGQIRGAHPLQYLFLGNMVLGTIGALCAWALERGANK